MAAVRLQSFNLDQKFFIRHHNSEGEMSELGIPGPLEDFAWNVEDRGRDNDGVKLVAFRSENFPDRFLRHKNFRILLERDDASEQFRKDSTFRQLNGRRGAPEDGWRSFESTNFRDHFIAHIDFHVFIRPKDSPNLNSDATFKKVPVT
jgi:hypothetical protein